MRLTPADQRFLMDRVRMFRYGADETIQRAGTVPLAMKFVVSGQARLAATAPDGSLVTVRTLEEGDFLGQTALTREPVAAHAVALDEVTDPHNFGAIVRSAVALGAHGVITLKDRAAKNHRSLNSEILAILEAAVNSQQIDTNENLRKARALRQKFSGLITEADLQAAKRAGRS